MIRCAQFLILVATCHLTCLTLCHFSPLQLTLAHRYSTDSTWSGAVLLSLPRVTTSTLHVSPSTFYFLPTRLFIYWILRGCGSCLAIFGPGWRSFVGINRISPLAIFVEAFAAMTMATPTKYEFAVETTPTTHPPTHHQHRLDTHQQ